MEHIKNFLETSTIHGLTYISTTKKFVRIFWTLVVIAGFTGAGVIIYQSFQAWKESPIKTTMESKPIREMTLPKVTVCPPKDTYTDLNYDLTRTKNMTLKNDTKDELTEIAVMLLYDQLFDSIMKNLSDFHEEERYYNWYHGYTEITLPRFRYGTSYTYGERGTNYMMSTTSTSGTFATPHFGEKFDADKVDTHFFYLLNIVPPISESFFRSNSSYKNVTLHFELERTLLKDLTTGKDEFYSSVPVEMNQEKETHISFSKNFTFSQLTDMPIVSHSRSVILEDIKKQKINYMPGFRVSWVWYFSGMEVEPYSAYSNTETSVSLTPKFVRNSSSSKIHISVILVIFNLLITTYSESQSGSPLHLYIYMIDLNISITSTKLPLFL